MANNLGVSSPNVGGDYDTWGDDYLADHAILNKFAGDTLTVADTTGTVLLDVEDCQNFSILANGGSSSQVDIRVPDSIKRYWYVRNDRASGAITVRCAAGGTAVTMAAGERRLVYSDGTNCADLTITTLAIASVTGLQTALDAKASLAGPTFTGVPSGPTAAPGTNSTQLSTTAFVKAAIDVVLGGVSSSFDTLAEIVAGMQPLDSDLTAIAALSTTSYGRSVLIQANAAALRTLAGTVIGTDVQAYDAALLSLAGLSLAQGDILYATAADTLARLPKGTAAQALLMNAGATAPEWGTAGQPIPTTSTLAVGSLAYLQYTSSTAVANGGTASGSNLELVTATNGGGATQTGTWKNISGATQDADGGASKTQGYWVRTA